MSQSRHALTALLLMLAASGPQAAGTQLFAFVGQKISVDEFKAPSKCPQLVEEKPDGTATVCFEIPNAAFHAQYRVLQPVHGQYDGPVIRFDAFDHYGRPRFAQYEHVLLFVSKAEDGRWVHVKYQYFPVYETVNGGWAGCGSADRFEAPQRRGPSTAQPIAFKQPVVESLQGVKAEGLNDWYPATDWLITPQGATCLRGTPLAQLLEAKTRVLKARGLVE